MKPTHLCLQSRRSSISPHILNRRIVAEHLYCFHFPGRVSHLMFVTGSSTKSQKRLNNRGLKAGLNNWFLCQPLLNLSNLPMEIKKSGQGLAVKRTVLISSLCNYRLGSTKENHFHHLGLCPLSLVLFVAFLDWIYKHKEQDV